MSQQTYSVIILALEGVIVGLLLLLFQRFGQWRQAEREKYQSNVIFYRQAVKILEYAQELLKQEPAA